MSTCPCHYSLLHHPPLSCWATTEQQPSPVTPSQHAANIFMFIIIQILSNVYNIPYLKLSKNLLLLIDLLFLTWSFCSFQHCLELNFIIPCMVLLFLFTWMYYIILYYIMYIVFIYLDVRLCIQTLLFQSLKDKSGSLEQVWIFHVAGAGVRHSLLLQVALVSSGGEL